MPGICRVMPFFMKTGKSIVFVHSLSFVKNPKFYPPNDKFGFYILPRRGKYVVYRW